MLARFQLAEADERSLYKVAPSNHSLSPVTRGRRQSSPKPWRCPHMWRETLSYSKHQHIRANGAFCGLQNTPEFVHSAGTVCLVTEAHSCEQLAQGCYAALSRRDLNPWSTVASITLFLQLSSKQSVDDVSWTGRDEVQRLQRFCRHSCCMLVVRRKSDIIIDENAVMMMMMMMRACLCSRLHDHLICDGRWRHCNTVDSGSEQNV